jgi:hypothetical protein
MEYFSLKVIKIQIFNNIDTLLYDLHKYFVFNFKQPSIFIESNQKYAAYYEIYSIKREI